MIEYSYNGTTEYLKNELSEITLKEFITIVEKQKDNEGDVEYYLTTFELLGLSKELCDAIDTTNLFKLINDFKESLICNGTFIKEVEIEGYKYTANTSFINDEFVVNGRDFAKIESKMKVDEFGWIGYALARLFKREDLTDVEHKDETHIKNKKKLFLEHVTMDVALPYILGVTNDYINNIKLLAS